LRHTAYRRGGLLLYLGKDMRSQNEVIQGANCELVVFSNTGAANNNPVIPNARLQIIIKNSVALVNERTVPAERPPLVGEFSARTCG
jgi:hypothetical protein